VDGFVNEPRNGPSAQKINATMMATAIAKARSGG
jgi:hypothetical protein